MSREQEEQLAVLEELVLKAEIEEPWVYKALEWLSIQWNSVLADNLYNYLVLSQDGNYFLKDVFELPSDQSRLDGELRLGRVLGK